MTVEIRPAGPEAAPVVHRLTQAAFAGQETLTPPSGALHETEDVVREQLAKRAGLVAYAGGVPAGCLRIVEGDDGRLHVRRVSVDPAYRGRGICSALMRHAEDAARADGRTALWLGVRDQLPDNLAVYRHLGYETVAVHEFWVELRKEL